MSTKSKICSWLQLAATLATQEVVVGQLLPVMSDKTSPCWFLNNSLFITGLWWTIILSLLRPQLCVKSFPALTNYLNITDFRQQLLRLTCLLSPNTVRTAWTILHQGEKNKSYAVRIANFFFYVDSLHNYRRCRFCEKKLFVFDACQRLKIS